MNKKREGRHKRCRTCRTTNKSTAAEQASVSIKQTRALRLPRPYEQCARTERYKRRKRGREALEAIVVPPEALKKRKLNAAAVDVVHLSKAARTQMRSVPSIRLPSERSIAAVKGLLELSHGTAVATFANGSYVTDPIKLVRMATLGRTHLVVGGDGGGGFLKLGVTFVSARGIAKFVCLLVADCGEKHEELVRFTQPGLTPMTGDSAPFTNMFEVLQHFLTIEGAYLHGDWKFLSCILAHMGPSSNYPCFICNIELHHLLSPNYSLRNRSTHPSDMNGMYRRAPLLTCLPTRIVPLPLHVFLGIGNRILDKLYLKTFGRANFDSVLHTIKTIHAPGKGGLSDLHQLNGMELRKWLKRKCDEKLFDTLSSLSDLARENLNRAARWLSKLSKFLLASKEWELTEVFVMKHLVDEIHQQWCSTIGDTPFPKLHMLRHCYEFLKRHRILGRVSESEMESCHGQMNRLYHHNHLNQANHPLERIKRTHRDICVRIVQAKASSTVGKRRKAEAVPAVRMTRARSA